jgi:hypothetical protein
VLEVRGQDPERVEQVIRKNDPVSEVDAHVVVAAQDLHEPTADLLVIDIVAFALEFVYQSGFGTGWAPRRS